MYRISLMPFRGLELELVRRIIVLPEGTIRHSRPEITDDGYSGAAAYLWRQVVFVCGTRTSHACLPVMAYHYLPDIPERDQLAKWLEALADKVLLQIPKSEWHGIAKWIGLL